MSDWVSPALSCGVVLSVGLASPELRGNNLVGKLTSSIDPQLALPCPDFLIETLYNK